LLKELQMHARDLAREPPTACEVQAHGEPKALSAAVTNEILQIGREALNNAFRHSSGSAISLTISYLANEVRIEVRDNGIGMQPPGESNREHWGVRGMMERAAAINGSLEIGANTGGGTCVTLTVPTSTAHPDELMVNRTNWKKLASVFSLR